MAIKVSIKGEFICEINEQGMNLNKKEDLEYVKEDIINHIENTQNITNFIKFVYDKNNLKIEKGEE